MATLKFKSEENNPFQEKNHAAANVPHPTDYKLISYLNKIRGESVRTTIDFALFGTGRAGIVHLGNLLGNPIINVKYIVEADRSRWSFLRAQWHLDQATFLLPDDIDQVTSDPSVRACVVATPTPTHERIVRKCLAAKKDVFCEKPLAESLDHTRLCYTEAEANGAILFCAFQRRFDPSFADVFQRVRTGEVGTVQIIKSISHDCPPISMHYMKSSGGIFHDSAVHDIDIITWIIGELPIKVYTAGSLFHLKDIDDFDMISLTLHYPSGAIGQVELVRHSPCGYHQRIEVLGAKGFVRAKNEQPVRTELWNASGIHQVPPYSSYFSRYWEAYRREMDHFINVLRGQEARLIVTGRSTLAVSKIATACQESAKKGEPVLLEWSDEEIPEGYRQ